MILAVFILACVADGYGGGYGGGYYDGGDYDHSTEEPANDGGYYDYSTEEPANDGAMMDKLPPGMDFDTRLAVEEVGNHIDRNNYRSEFNLGEVTHTHHFDWRGSERHTEETSRNDAIFIFDDNDKIVYGMYIHEFTYHNKKLMAQSAVYYDGAGNLVREVKPSVDTFSGSDDDDDALGDMIQGQEEEDYVHGDMMDEDKVRGFMGSIKEPLGRRALEEEGEVPEISLKWLTQLTEKRSRRRLGRQLQDNGEQLVEISVAFYYTDEARVFSFGSVPFLTNQTMMGVEHANSAFAHSNISDLTLAMHDELTETTFPAAGSLKVRLEDWTKDVLTPEQRNVADIIVVIASSKEFLVEGQESLAGRALTIPNVKDADGYDRDKAVVIVRHDTISTLTLIHEIGHLLGLGHLAGTKHCARKEKGPQGPTGTWLLSNSCGHTIKCGEHGFRTIMGIPSNLGRQSRLPVGQGRDRFKCQNGEVAGTETRVAYFSSPDIHYFWNGVDEGPCGTQWADSRSQIIISLGYVPYYHHPTMNPTAQPVLPPTVEPSKGPTLAPTEKPTASPTKDPTPAPTRAMDCQGYWSACTADCEDGTERTFIVIQHRVGQGAECPTVSPDCNPGEDACPENIDCEGDWSDCTTECETSAQRNFLVTVAQSGQGDACPTVAPNCNPGEDACPENIDCEGDWSCCTTACETSAQRNFIVKVAPSGLGDACPTVAPICSPGEDACPLNINCEGHWSPCTVACENSASRNFIVIVAQSGQGTACPTVAPNCQPGEDACPANIDCEGYWSSCTAACETGTGRNFIVTQAQSGQGSACSTVAPDCAPGNDSCPDGKIVAKGGPRKGYIWRSHYSYTGCEESGGCDTRIAGFGETHAVRCCSDGSRSGWRKMPGCSAYVRFTSSCIYRNYASANSYCQAEGARLCTAKEVLHGCTMLQCQPQNMRLVWTSSTVTESAPVERPFETPVAAPSLSSAKYCLSIGDPHIRTPFESKNDYTTGEKLFFIIPGVVTIKTVQDVADQPGWRYSDKATVNEIKILANGVEASITATRWDIPNSFRLSEVSASHFSHSRSFWNSWFQYMITIPGHPEIAIVWQHWVTPWWGAQLGVGVRYTGNYDNVIGQCMDPDNLAEMDCDDCDFGGEPMDVNPLTCNALDSCCANFAEEPFLELSCKADHYYPCCEEAGGESCCGDYMPARCPEDFECMQGEHCNVETGQCEQGRRLLKLFQ